MLALGLELIHLIRKEYFVKHLVFSTHFFSFYLCDLVLKMNGKGGQPVYVKVAGQETGRCTPR